MINVKNLSFTYPGNNTQTIKNISFTIDKGEIFGFLGPSGAGKSTTQKILIGILKNYTGDIKIMDKNLKNFKNDFYEHIGVAFEFPNFYSKLTALENLNFFRAMYKEKTIDPIELLKTVGLEKDKSVQVGNYSKGMKMRLNFCRALINDPEIIFLDEPTSGLDPVNAKKLKDIILKKKESGKTILITTHNMNVADTLCDRVAFIVDGIIKLIDSPRNLKVGGSKKTVKIEFMDAGRLTTEELSFEEIKNSTRFFDILKNKQIETMHSQEATLEDIFIETTGRGLL